MSAYTPPTQEQMMAKTKDRDEQIRMQWVKTMEARIVREELMKCHRSEGVNHYAICKPLVETYMDLLKDAKIKGYRMIDM